jgi:FxsC-like protein
VPLYSRRYFQSPHCGKEWFAFACRTASHAQRALEPARVIVPALWNPVPGYLLPAVARAVPVDDGGIAEYGSLGLFGIIKLTRFRDHYRAALRTLAGQIVKAAEAAEVGDPVLVESSALLNAFGTEPGSESGEHRVRVTIVAPRRDDLPSVRGSVRGVEHYGRAARDWNPYVSDSVRALADHVADLARGLGLRPEIGDLADHGAELLASGPARRPEVLIVDAWAAMQADCRRLLRQFDKLDKPWVQVIIPWNQRDSETAAAEHTLRRALHSAMPRKLAAGRVTSALALRGVPNLSSFSTVLPTVIQAAVRQYFKHAPVSAHASQPEWTEQSSSLLAASLTPLEHFDAKR